jgi:hypothetical protein
MALRRGHFVFFLAHMELKGGDSMEHDKDGDPKVGATSPAVEQLTGTHGEAFSDGTMIELVRQQGDPTLLALLLWDGRQAVIGGPFHRDGKVYTTPSLDPVLTRTLRLPSGVMPYGSTAEMFAGIAELAIRYCGVAEDCASKIAFFAFSSWLTTGSIVRLFFLSLPLLAARRIYC